MNYKLSLSAAVIILFSACSKDPVNPTPAPVSSNIKLTNGLIAYYPFNGNTNDESGNGLNGVLFNGATLTHDQNGVALSALNLNGSQALRVTNTGNKINIDTAMTISFHAMVRSLNRACWVGIVDPSSGAGQTFVIGTPVSPSLNLLFSLVKNEVDCSTVPTGQVTNASSTVVPKVESWYHVLATYRKGSMKLFINGILAGTGTSPDPTTRICPSAQLLLGGWLNSDLNAGLNGKMDEVRIYNRELNADEIAELSKKFR
jgi:hypothetical protein